MKISRKDFTKKIWRACDIMMRDDDTMGVPECMEQLPWLIFLKVFEDIERRLEDKAKFAGKVYQPIIEYGYRWSAWARKDWGLGRIGEKHPLIKFIDDELFPYLRSLTGSAEKEKITTIFRGITGNRMKSAYNLKDIITLIDRIDFNDVEDSHIVSQVYEELLLKLGKEQGIAGEFYTPRPIVRLTVKIVNPQIGETIFDPFCGSCGFSVESYKRMIESKELSVEDYETLQKRTFYAQEKKPLSYRIGVMNCILHEILTPNVVRKNTFETNIRNIPEAQKFDVILTNPPFGGKESRQIQKNFPIQSRATELLALQYVTRILKHGGRCGIVVSEGILFRGDAFAKVKKELLEDFNLHTIISLPSGTFANVAASGQGPKTNLLFFNRTRNSKEIWYYDFAGYSEEVLNKNYTKANPIEDEDLKDCYEKWKKREISRYSWVVPVEEVIRRGYDLTAKNPNRKEKFEYMLLKELIASILEKERQILEILEEIQNIFEGENLGKDKDSTLDSFMKKQIIDDKGCREVINDLCKLEKWKQAKLEDLIIIESGRRPKGGSTNKGVPSLGGEQLSPDGKIYWDKLRFIPEDFFNSLQKGKVKLNDVLIVKDGATTGKVAFVDKLPFNKVAVNEHVFIIRSLNEKLFLNKYLFYVLFSEIGQNQIHKLSHGTTRGGITRENVKCIRVPLPLLEEQKCIVAKIEEILSRVEQVKKLREKALKQTEQIMQSTLYEVFSKAEENENYSKLY